MSFISFLVESLLFRGHDMQFIQDKNRNCLLPQRLILWIIQNTWTRHFKKVQLLPRLIAVSPSRRRSFSGTNSSFKTNKLFMVVKVTLPELKKKKKKKKKNVLSRPHLFEQPRVWWQTSLSSGISRRRRERSLLKDHHSPEKVLQCRRNNLAASGIPRLQRPTFWIN